MAVNKVLKKTVLSIEFEAGVDKTGGPIYRKKNFSSVKGDALAENINNVAEEIKAILAKNTRSTIITDSSEIEVA